MRHLKIRNVGPLKEVDIELKRINVIIGPQSSGKSCVLKIACHCAWVEKRIQIEQSPKRFKEKGEFVRQLTLYYKMNGYFRNDSYIEYETDYVCFSYDGKTENFDFKWKDKRWDYKRTKICYIPAERNIVTVWSEQPARNLKDSYTKNFLNDWSFIRARLKDFPILDLDVKYHFNSTHRIDEVKVGKELTLNVDNASSGLQSIIPICGFLEYFFEKQFSSKKDNMVEVNAENIDILKIIYKENFEKKIPRQDNLDVNNLTSMHLIAGHPYMFRNGKDAKRCKKIYTNFVDVNCSDIYLEEPELNLFPQTQYNLLNWTIERTNEAKKHSLFLTTHSPYIMSSLNNMLQASNVIKADKSKQEEVEKIVSSKRILSLNDVGAYAIEKGKMKSIIDTKNKLISAEELDKISDVIAEEFDKLLLL